MNQNDFRARGAHHVPMPGLSIFGAGRRAVVVRALFVFGVVSCAWSLPAQWQAIGPSGGEAPFELVPHPHRSDAVYATAAHGVLRSLDGGRSWMSVAYGRALRMQHLAVNPVRPEVIVAGGPNGAIRSVDDGATWQLLSGEAVDALSFDAGGTLFVAWGDRGVLQSSNDGASWSSASAGLSSQGFVTQFVATASGLYASQRNTIHRWDGSRWQVAGRPGNRDVTAFAVAANGVVYAADTGGIARSTNGGSSWTRIHSGLPAGLTSEGSDVVLDLETAADGSIAYAALLDGGAFIARDGVTWQPLGPREANQAPFAILATGTSLLMTSNPHGITRSDDGGVTWVPSNRGFSDHDIRDLAVAGQTMFAASFSASSLFATASEGMTWESFGPLSPAPVMSVAVSPADPRWIYAGTGGDDVRISSDAGATWRTGTTGGGTIHRLAVDPANPAFAYAMAAGYGAFGTSDGGFTWRNITNTLSMGTTMAMRHLAVDPNVPSVLYLAAEKAYVSRDAGTTWSVIPGVGNYVTASEAAAYAFIDRRVVRSTDAASTWTTVTPVLPQDYPAQSKLVDIAIDESIDAVYLAVLDLLAVPSRVMLFRSVAGGAWETLPEPPSLVQTLAARGGVLYAGTETQGVFAMSFVKAVRRRSVRS